MNDTTITAVVTAFGTGLFVKLVEAIQNRHIKNVDVQIDERKEFATDRREFEKGLRADKKELEDKLDKLSDDLEKTRNVCIDLREEISVLRTENRELRRNYERLQTNYDQLKKISKLGDFAEALETYKLMSAVKDEVDDQRLAGQNPPD